jgi:hypothetical protein
MRRPDLWAVEGTLLATGHGVFLVRGRIYTRLADCRDVNDAAALLEEAGVRYVVDEERPGRVWIRWGGQGANLDAF